MNNPNFGSQVALVASCIILLAIVANPWNLLKLGLLVATVVWLQSLIK